MSAWWRQFGVGYEPVILTLREGGEMLGVAPLKCREGVASFIGDTSVCDYFDFIVVPGREQAFSEALFNECAVRGIVQLDLEALRLDSVAARYVLPCARNRGLDFTLSDDGVSYAAALPTSFDDYLAGLSHQQRREILRKQRRLSALGNSNFRVPGDWETNIPGMETFLAFMAESRRDKADFLTDNMRSYFNGIAVAMLSYGLLRLGFLDVEAKTVAGGLMFEYNDTVYLYNSGYNASFADLGVGLLSKLAAIDWAIGQKKAVFDFLKGPEIYKERLGGKQVKLVTCRLSLGQIHA